MIKDQSAGPGGSGHVTLSQVAAAAGVSKSTASKALNGKPEVNERTRQRVLRAAEELKFSPNELARGLLAGKTRTVGVITSDLSGRFVPRIMFGAEQALGVQDATVLLSNSGMDPEREGRLIMSFLERRVDGLIIVDHNFGPRPPALYADRIRTVYAFGTSTNPADTSIRPDMRQGSRLATEHLISVGCRRIAYIGGPESALAAQLRAEGYRDAVAAAPDAVEAASVAFGSWSERWGSDATARLLDGFAPDGIVAGSDEIARGVVDRIRFSGLHLPRDIAVVGYDNWEPIALGALMPLSTIDQNLADVGVQAVRELYDPEGMTPGVQLVPGQLVVRESSRR